MHNVLTQIRLITIDGMMTMQADMRNEQGMVTAPHHLASEAGLAVLRDGGSAIEAAIATAACARGAFAPRLPATTS